MVKELLEKNQIAFEENKNLSDYTSWKIGGPASFIVHPKNKKELKILMRVLSEYEQSFFVLGNGSNILVRDEGCSEVIIKLNDEFFRIEVKENQIIAGASVPLALLATKAAEHTLSGLAFTSGIPGTIGGALIMNAGAYGEEMKGIVLEAEIFDTKKHEYYTLSNKELIFSYRNSLLKNNKHYILVSVTMKLDKGDRSAILQKMKEYKSERHVKQPYDYPSAGSVFKNPEGDSAGRLIESLGLKGRSVGGAQISDKHANFILNKGGAKAKDVLALISLIENEIYDHYKIRLEKEIIIL